ncbi:MAG TPA: hypothetical protein VIK39_17475 [Candidatus Angelobacter sp.]
MKYFSSLMVLILLVSASFLFAANSSSRDLDAGIYLVPKLQVGQILGNIFSRTVSYAPEGADEAVWRASGTAIYTVVDNSPANLVLDGHFRYDGRPQSTGKTEIKEGGKTLCYRGKCGLNTDASGPLYNPFLWGDAKGSIRESTNWEVSIGESWELGPAGKEMVTVLLVDPKNHSVTLKREGTGEGYFGDEAKQIHLTKDGKSYLVDVVPGKAHWIGYTTFREGLVMNDELLVDRQVNLTSKELGNIQALQREYILLNAMPPHSQ